MFMCRWESYIVLQYTVNLYDTDERMGVEKLY